VQTASEVAAVPYIAQNRSRDEHLKLLASQKENKSIDKSRFI